MYNHMVRFWGTQTIIVIIIRAATTGARAKNQGEVRGKQVGGCLVEHKHLGPFVS